MSAAEAPLAAHYTFRVSWSSDDGEYVATCIEFPSLSWLAPARDEALAGLEDLIAAVVAEMHENEEPVPTALAERSYSGKFNLRVGQALHQELSIQAAEDGLSLNQYVVRRLSAAG